MSKASHNTCQIIYNSIGDRTEREPSRLSGRKRLEVSDI